MDVQQLVKQLQGQLEKAFAEHELLAPILSTIVGLLAVIFLLYRCGASSSKKKRTGTVYEGGVRRR